VSSDSLMTVIFILVALAAGLIAGFFVRHFQAQRETRTRQSEGQRILEQAQAKAREIELSSRDEALKLRGEAESELSRRRSELGKEEERLGQRRADVDRRLDQVDKRDQTLSKRQSALDKRTNDLEQQVHQIVVELERVSGMTREEAKSKLLEQVERDARNDMVRVIHQIEEEARQEGDRRAREIIADAIQRVASDHVAEISVSVVPLPSDEMKGRIIGRNGRTSGPSRRPPAWTSS